MPKRAKPSLAIPMPRETVELVEQLERLGHLQTAAEIRAAFDLSQKPERTKRRAR